MIASDLSNALRDGPAEVFAELRQGRSSTASLNISPTRIVLAGATPEAVDRLPAFHYG